MEWNFNFFAALVILWLVSQEIATSAKPESKDSRQLMSLLRNITRAQGRSLAQSVNSGRSSKQKHDIAAWKLTQGLKLLFKIPQVVYFDTPELIRKRGYAVETHHVITSDGYILLLHHILGPRHSGRRASTQKLDVALLVPSIFGSSSNFVHNEPHESLGYILADSGYDVWLGNLRGGRSGINHTRLNADTDSLFWDFSLDEIAQIDLPALVDFVVGYTRQPKLFFFTYSASTLAFFMAGAPKARIMEKVRLAVTFAPVAYVRYPKAYIKAIARLMLTIQGVAQKLLGGPMYRGSDLLSSVIHVACSDDSPFRHLCVFVATTLFGGTNKGNYSKNGFSSMLASAASGTSVKTLTHFAQQAFAPGMQMYDYGSEAANDARYGAPASPLYNLSDVSAPVVMCTAPNDATMSEQDLQLMMRDLPQLVERIVPAQRDFGHFDLIFSRNARELIYDQVLEIMKQY